MALTASIVLLGALLVLVALVARWMVTRALRPVAQMTAQATDWSEHDLDRRFGLGEPHDELTLLAATLDSLLGRVAASLRHEQRFSSEISHELRTPLTKVRAEAELALRQERSGDSYREALRQVVSAADQMERIMDTLLSATASERRTCRASGGGCPRPCTCRTPNALALVVLSDAVTESPIARGEGAFSHRRTQCAAELCSVPEVTALQAASCTLSSVGSQRDFGFGISDFGLGEREGCSGVRVFRCSGIRNLGPEHLNT